MFQSDKATKAADAVSDRARIVPATVTGWGIDADTTNDPTWPMRDRSILPLDDETSRPVDQLAEVEILMSVEHAHRPAVIGTSAPPRGLSGVIRRGAFRFSEGQWGHWLLLMAADRIDVVEGRIEDLLKRSPTGGTTEGLIRSPQVAPLLVGAVGVGLLAGLYLFRRR